MTQIPIVSIMVKKFWNIPLVATCLKQTEKEKGISLVMKPNKSV